MADSAACINELHAPEFHPDIINIFITNVLEKKDREREALQALLKGLFSQEVFTSDQLAKGITKVTEILPDLYIDLPQSPKHVATLVGVLVAHGALSISFVQSSLLSLVDPSPALVPSMAADFLKVDGSTKKLSDSERRNFLMQFLRPDQQNDAAMSNFIREKGLSSLFSTIVVQKQVETMIGDGSTEDSILKWIEVLYFFFSLLFHVSNTLQIEQCPRLPS